MHTRVAIVERRPGNLQYPSRRPFSASQTRCTGHFSRSERREKGLPSLAADEAIFGGLSDNIANFSSYPVFSDILSMTDSK